MAQVQFPLRVDGPRNLGDPYDTVERNHVIGCMQLFVGHLQTVAEKCIVNCMTDGVIRFSKSRDRDDYYNDYVLKVVLDCDCFRVDMSIKYTDSSWGMDDFEFRWIVCWDNLIIKKAYPRNKEFYKGPPGIQFLDRWSDEYSLYQSAARPMAAHNRLDDINIVRRATWTVLWKLRRLFIINELDRINITSNPWLMDKRLSIELKSKIIDDFVDMVNSAVDNELSALQLYADSTTWHPAPQPY